jgi:hypothetical protein
VKDWKSCERRVAELLGGHRVPVSGRGRGYTPDIEHPTPSIEVKSRKKIPAWLEDALLQAEASAKNGRLPMVVLHQDGQRYTGSLVVLRLEGFSKYLNRKEQHEE